MLCRPPKSGADRIAADLDAALKYQKQKQCNISNVFASHMITNAVSALDASASSVQRLEAARRGFAAAHKSLSSISVDARMVLVGVADAANQCKAHRQWQAIGALHIQLTAARGRAAIDAEGGAADSQNIIIIIIITST